MNTSIIAIVLAVLLGASIIGFLITLYNRLVMLRFNIDKAYKNIDVLLKQRADEIPNLVTIAKEKITDRAHRTSHCLLQRTTHRRKNSDIQQDFQRVGFVFCYIRTVSYPIVQ